MGAVRRTLYSSPGRFIQGCLKAAFLFGDEMHLLYADESGSVSDPTQKYFVLAGISVFERDTHWIEKDIDAIASRFNPEQPHSIELHGNPMRRGRGPWGKFSREARDQAVVEALTVSIRNRPNGIRLFGVVLAKQELSGQDISQIASEQLSSRFDMYLTRLHQRHNTQRGLIVSINAPQKNASRRWPGNSNSAAIPTGS